MLQAYCSPLIDGGYRHKIATTGEVDDCRTCSLMEVCMVC